MILWRRWLFLLFSSIIISFTIGDSVVLSNIVISWPEGVNFARTSPWLEQVQLSSQDGTKYARLKLSSESFHDHSIELLHSGFIIFRQEGILEFGTSSKTITLMPFDRIVLILGVNLTFLGSLWSSLDLVKSDEFFQQLVSRMTLKEDSLPGMICGQLMSRNYARNRYKFFAVLGKSSPPKRLELGA